MPKFLIAENKRNFILNERPVFYLADTVWTALNNASREEWYQYLDVRRQQGFNVLQISLLSVPNASGNRANHRFPFVQDSDGKPDFSQMDENFFEYGRNMLRDANVFGFTPALVLLWSLYVPGTAINLKFEYKWTMPLEVVEDYTERVVRSFDEFDPIYIISGDTDFGSTISLEYYRRAAATVKRLTPKGLTTLHIGSEDKWPNDFMHSNLFDFYMYQSSHFASRHSDNYQLAEEFLNLPVMRPIIHGEPSYEGHGYYESYGQFRRYDVRKSIWQSLFAGASAGFSYGAHGLWSWHHRGDYFRPESEWGEPQPWYNAMLMEGALDATFAASLMEKYELLDCAPAQELLDDLSIKNTEIRIARSIDGFRLAIYTPYNFQFAVKVPESEYHWIGFDLEKRVIFSPLKRQAGSQTAFPVRAFNSDALILGIRQ